MMVTRKTFVFCIIVLTIATKCCTERVEQQSNPSIESFMEQLFGEVDADHRFPRAISVHRPSPIDHSNLNRLPKPVRPPVQNHVENENDDHSTIFHPHLPVQNHVEDENDEHSTIFRPRRPVKNRVEDEDDDHDHDHSTTNRRPRRRKPPCPCPCGSETYFICPARCKHYTYCPPCPCPCGYNLGDDICPYGCRPRDTCDNPWM